MSSTQTSVKPHDELQYLDLIRDVLDTGELRPDRTGIGTLTLFAPPSLRFSLANSTLPLLTTKKAFLRPIIEELLWFIKGQTDSTLLSKKGVKIWDRNGSKEFLEKRRLGHRRVGDLGPVCGFQWRHFGAGYVDADTDYSGQGIDQLREVMRKIKEDPTDRRIIMSTWNPAGLSRSSISHHASLLSSDIPLMALPPCHMICQFYVHLPGQDNPSAPRRLSCLMYQRTSDLGLGVPFNIASHALLTHMIARVTDTVPHELVIQLGDAHIYRNHVDALRVQLTRQPRNFPTLRWPRDIADIEDFAYEDFIVEGYDPHPALAMKMNI